MLIEQMSQNKIKLIALEKIALEQKSSEHIRRFFYKNGKKLYLEQKASEQMAFDQMY
jgi:hypothetical protein